MFITITHEMLKRDGNIRSLNISLRDNNRQDTEDKKPELRRSMEAAQMSQWALVIARFSLTSKKYLKSDFVYLTAIYVTPFKPILPKIYPGKSEACLEHTVRRN